MAPSATERLNTLEAVTKSLQEDLAAHRAATDEKFVTLEKSVKDECAAIRTELGTFQTAIKAELSNNQAALIALLTPRRQNADLPRASTMPGPQSALSTPLEPTSVALPPSPNPANGLNESTGDIPSPIPLDPPTPRGLLFSGLAEQRPENSVETDAEYRARLTKEAKDFLKGRAPGENALEYQHRAAMRVALGAAFREHAATANADTSSYGRRRPIKPGIDPDEVEYEDPDDPPTFPDQRGQSEPARATPRASSRLRDDSEVWQRWWLRCRQAIVDKIDLNVGMNPLTGAPREHLRNIKIPVATVPYDGANNLQVFNTWLNEVLLYCSTYELTGPARDRTRTNAISSALAGEARLWYHTIGDLPDRPHTFKGWILALHARFVTRRAALTAQHEFDSCEYSPELGVQAFYHQLVMLNTTLSEPFDEPALSRKLLHSVPIRLIDYAIKARECSPGVTPLEVWVAELSHIEHSEEVTKLLHKERNAESRTRAIASTSSTPSRTRNDRSGRTAPAKASSYPTGDSKPLQVVSTVTPYRSTSGATGAGPTRTFASNACHACGQVGHYRGDPKCPKAGTYSRSNPGKFPYKNYSKANRLNAVAFDEPSDPDGDEESNFDGSQYDPDDDPAYAGDEPHDGATEDETPRLGTVRLHESGETWSLYALHQEDSDERVANALEQGVRDAYEGQPGFRASKGQKSSPQVVQPAVSKSPKDVNTSKSTVPVDSRLRYKVAEPLSRLNRDRRCLVAEVDVDGVAALTLFDSGSQVDAISPDFARALQLDHFKLERTMPLQLGTKGSHATFSYEVEPALSYKGASFGTRRIDVINIDRYDLLLGAPFFNQHGVVLDFNDRVIRVGDIHVPSISTVEETSILAKRKNPSKGSA